MEGSVLANLSGQLIDSFTMGPVLTSCRQPLYPYLHNGSYLGQLQWATSIFLPSQWVLSWPVVDKLFIYFFMEGSVLTNLSGQLLDSFFNGGSFLGPL